MKRFGILIISVVAAIAIGCAKGGPGESTGGPGVAPVPPYPPGQVVTQNQVSFTGYMKANSGWKNFLKKNRYVYSGNSLYFCYNLFYGDCSDDNDYGYGVNGDKVLFTVTMDYATTHALEQAVYANVAFQSYTASDVYRSSAYMTNQNSKFRIENIYGRYGSEAWDKEISFVFDGQPEDPQVTMRMYFDGQEIGTARLVRSGVPGYGQYQPVPTPYNQQTGQPVINGNPMDTPGGSDPSYSIGGKRWY